MRFLPIGPPLIAMLLVVALSGCAGEQATASNATPSATAEPATPSAEPAESGPQSAFGGDCDAVAPAEEIADATGVSAVLQPRADDGSASDWSVVSLGGIRCVWIDSAGNGAWVTAIPVAAVAPEVVDAASEGQPYCYGSGCSFSEIVGDWWFAGVVSTGPDSGSPAEAAVGALVDGFASRAGAVAAVVPTAAPGTWSSVPDCATLDLEVATVDDTGLDLDASPGNGPAEAGPGVYGALSATGSSSCLWTKDAVLVSTALLPGGQWVLDRLAARAGASEVVVPGGSDALLLPDAGDASEVAGLYLTDGVNLVFGRSADLTTEQLGAMLGSILAAVEGS
ncbi:hypothetical protein SAMN05428970_3467 [Agromyces sp. CF514]|uniref:hypothetical protein n=1 Tax=Agromyces sp. CF514 TaxID=1881031 RepID=UPI0008EEC59C|nr:hypothetical protein [Agromyces sp. CF514]SFR87625.1 hypothetical protein SAMN05428970_3467 [Agromyces sp. CF514]